MQTLAPSSASDFVSGGKEACTQAARHDHAGTVTAPDKTTGAGNSE